MSERAQRLGEYLERCGWLVWNNDTVRVKCECGNEVETKYCPDCGRKTDGTEKTTLEQMEGAIKYALEET